MDFGVFKSGSDVRAVASEGVAGEEVMLTGEIAARIANAFAFRLFCRYPELKDPAVAVGRDCRISGEGLLSAVVGALSSHGVRVFDCGLSSTPAMFAAIADLGCAAAIQITASHHPFNRNGIKFFTPSGGITKTDLSEILYFAEREKALPEASAEVKRVDHLKTYAESLKKVITGENKNPLPLKGLKIAVDAGNGVGGFFARDVLAPLGADVSGSRFLEPDGNFPNHIPNPEDPSAMRSASEAVLSSGSDIGIVFDTDVDRAAVVGPDGEEINRNRLIALASVIALGECPGGTIVTDSVTSDGLTDFITNTLGGRHRRFKRGYNNVISEAERLCLAGVDCPLAIETSGHAAFRENRFLDDGAYLAAKIILLCVRLRSKGKTLRDAIAALPEPACSIERRYKIIPADFRAAGEEILSDFQRAVLQNEGVSLAESFEGVRVSFDRDHGDGWALVRLSVHDPVLVINQESGSAAGMAMISAITDEFLAGRSDISAL